MTIDRITGTFRCYCGDDETDFEVYGKANDCETPCVGDSASICGEQVLLSFFRFCFFVNSLPAELANGGAWPVLPIGAYLQ